MERDRGAIDILLNSIRSEKIRAILMLLVAITPIIWQQGLESGWWGFLEGEIEKTNKRMAIMHIGKEPLDRVKVINTEDDLLEVLVYSSGIALVIRRTKQADGSIYQQHRWLTKSPPNEVTITALVSNHMQPRTAYAQIAPAPPANTPYRDRLIEWLDDHLAKVERLFANGCIEIIIINVATGQIVETLSRSCPQKG